MLHHSLLSLTFVFLLTKHFGWKRYLILILVWIILTMDNLLCPCVHKTTMKQGLLRPVYTCPRICIECAFNSIWCPFERPHWMHTPFTSSQTTSRGGFNPFWPFELVSRVSTWPQTRAHDSYHEKLGNNSIQMKGVDWITKGQQMNVVIVPSTDATVEVMVGTEWTVEATRTLLSFRDRQI